MQRLRCALLSHRGSQEFLLLQVWLAKPMVSACSRPVAPMLHKQERPVWYSFCLPTWHCQVWGESPSVNCSERKHFQVLRVPQPHPSPRSYRINSKPCMAWACTCKLLYRVFAHRQCGQSLELRVEGVGVVRVSMKSRGW